MFVWDSRLACVFMGVLEYAFVNLSGRASYISDDNFAFRGTWSSGSVYAPPVDVVDYNNGKFIVLVANTNTPPLYSSSWSELVLRGTIAPTDPFAIANTALTTANAASILALAASGTANQAILDATEALALSATGTNLANSALQLISAGTTAGTNFPIPVGTNQVSYSGLALGYTPSSVVCTVEVPVTSNLNLWPTLVGPPTSDSFTVRLNGTTDETGYFLHWLARR